jgi:hypothetical protein
MKINLGCGDHVVEGFLGVDRYPCQLSPFIWEHKFCFVFRASTLTFEMEVTK